MKLARILVVSFAVAGVIGWILLLVLLTQWANAMAGMGNNAIWPGDPTGQNYIAHFWHSAQFRGDYWQQQGYWIELLGSEAFNLK